jgi:hypothetical protein
MWDASVRIKTELIPVLRTFTGSADILVRMINKLKTGSAYLSPADTGVTYVAMGALD